MLHYADAYEPISLDEAFLDISGMGSQYPTLGSIGRAIKEEIRSAVHLTALSASRRINSLPKWRVT